MVEFRLLIAKKGGFGAPDFVGGRDTTDFGHAFSNYTYVRPCGQIWCSSVQRAQRVADEKKKKKKERKKQRNKERKKERIPGKM